MKIHKHISAVNWLRSFIVCCGLVFCTLVASVNAADFEGKTIKIIVPFREGGGTDVWARFWAPLIANELPGQPKVEVVNIAGGGGTKGANQFYTEAGTNGEVLFASSASVLYAYLLGDTRVKYDFNDWQAIMASPTGGVVYADKNSVDNGGSIGHPWRVFTQGPSQLGLILLLSLELLNQRALVSFGAAGSGDTFKAIEAGISNIDMQTTGSYKTNVAKLIKDKKVEPLYTFGVIGRDGQTIERDPTFPEIPTLVEYYGKLSGQYPEGKVYDVWRTFFLAGFPVQKMFVLPKNTNPDVVQTYEQTLERIMNNPDSLPETKEEILGVYEPTVGPNAQALLQDVIKVNTGYLEWYKDWVKAEFEIFI